MKKFELLAILLLALLLRAGSLRIGEEALSARIAPEILRLHILADSDRAADQSVKLEVRSLLLDLLREQLPDNSGKEETAGWIRSHKTRIEQAADALLQKRGFSYRSRLSLVYDYFPARTYGKLRLPCGYYDAVRITLGSGRGHNWWCILYPQFCFLEDVCTTIPEESMAVLTQKISRDDLLLLKEYRPGLPFPDPKLTNFKISFRLLSTQYPSVP